MSLLAFDPSTSAIASTRCCANTATRNWAAGACWAEIERRHFDYFLGWRRRLPTTCLAPNRSHGWTGWMRKVTTSAPRWHGLFAQPELAGGVADLVIALGWFWRIRSHVMEGRQWLERGLNLPA